MNLAELLTRRIEAYGTPEGISRSTLHRYLAGTRLPKSRLRKKLCESLDLDPNVLNLAIRSTEVGK